MRDSVSSSNGEDGIVCWDDCLAASNMVKGNQGAGLRGPVDCSSATSVAYGENHFSQNGGGQVLDCVVSVVTNVCNQSPCP